MREMCRSRLWLLYWVSTTTRRKPGVGQVGQGEVDQAVVAPKGDGGLGTVQGQRQEALALTSGQDHR